MYGNPFEVPSEKGSVRTYDYGILWPMTRFSELSHCPVPKQVLTVRSTPGHSKLWRGKLFVVEVSHDS